MEWSYPWMSIDEDREYDDGDFARFYASLFTNGVSLTTDNSLMVTTNSTGGMRVQVTTGAAFIDGRTYFNSTAVALPIAVASSTQDRIDSVVIRMDKGLREIKLMIKSGSTVVNRTNDIYELQIATIKVPRNASNITADLITDKRADETVCGYSTPYQKLSVSGLEAQYKAMLQTILDNMTQYTEDEKEAFESAIQTILTNGELQLSNQAIDWQNFLQSITDELTENQAVNLQNQITKLKAGQETFSVTHDLKSYPQVAVTAWSDGLGVTGVGETTWLGTAPETIPFTVVYPSWNELAIKVPLDFKMVSPIVTETEPLNFLLVEGRKSLRIKILGGN